MSHRIGSLVCKLFLIPGLLLALSGNEAAAQVVPPLMPPPPPPDAAGGTNPGAPAAVLAAAPDANAPRYGVAFRTRWITVPGWFLGLFTKQNVPVSTYGIGGEFFRRKGDFDIV